MSEVTVVIPSIPTRHHLLQRAVMSVYDQTHPISEIIIPIDHKREGAAMNRQRGLDKVTTEWFLPVDDDDWLYPNCVKGMLNHALATDSDMVYAWYDVGSGGSDPRPDLFGVPFDSANPIQTTIVVLARTEMAQACGYVDHGDLETLRQVDRHYHGEDALYIRRAVDLGAKITHLPERLWVWDHHGRNTSGLPTRW